MNKLKPIWQRLCQFTDKEVEARSFSIGFLQGDTDRYTASGPSCQGLPEAQFSEET